jgi:broad specificity phosphatase PhoE
MFIFRIILKFLIFTIDIKILRRNDVKQMKLIILRHGETVENKTGISQGQTPGTLTLTGINQAMRAGQRLKNEKIDIIYVSDLKRAVDTSKEITKYHLSVPVLFVPQLREMSKGIFDGKPKELVYSYQKSTNLPIWDYQWEQGESLASVQKRMVDFCKKLLKKHQDETVLLVTHGAIIATFLLYLFKKSPKELKNLRPQNSAITIVDIFQNGNHQIHLLNCTKHLQSI